MNTRRDPRDRRAHRLAAVAGGLSPELAVPEADPLEGPALAQAEVPKVLDQAERLARSAPLGGAVRLELGIEDWQAAARAAGPGWPEDFPSEGPPADLETANLPVQELDAQDAAALQAVGVDPASCTCAGAAPGLCLEDCRVCQLLDPELPCPAEELVPTEDAAEWRPADGDDQEQDGPAAGAAAPVPDPAPAAPDRWDQLAALPRVDGRVLAWASRHDSRSLTEFAVRDRLAHPVALQDRAWEHGPILDQGTVPPLNLHDGSSCTGNMAVNLRNILELMAAPLPGSPPPMATEADAQALYHHAQQLDEWPGESYPGTSVLAAMKAGQQCGWWGSYLWCRGTRDIAQALLQVGPVGIGIPFLAGMATPGPDGILTVAGEELGGHAMALFALRRTVAGQPGPWFGALQSYGPEVGDGGVVWIKATDLSRLLAGVGEAAVPLLATGGQL